MDKTAISSQQIDELLKIDVTTKGEEEKQKIQLHQISKYEDTSSDDDLNSRQHSQTFQVCQLGVISPQNETAPLAPEGPYPLTSVVVTPKESITSNQHILKHIFHLRKQTEMSQRDAHPENACKQTQVMITEEGLKSNDSNYNFMTFKRMGNTKQNTNVRTVKAVDRRCFNLTNLESLLTKKCTQATLKNQSVQTEEAQGITKVDVYGDTSLTKYLENNLAKDFGLLGIKQRNHRKAN